MAAATLGGATMASADVSQAGTVATQVLPVYFPLEKFAPQIDLAGKFAVITGASRGLGRATGEELVSKGVTVIGTSRNVAGVPDPPPFPLLDLDITSDASVKGFVKALIGHSSYPGHIDILINNAGRYVVGTIVPPPIAPDPVGYFLQQAQLGGETVYGGHVRVTNRLLPYMAQTSYSRVLFTVSANGYWVGGSRAEDVFGDGILSYQNIYTSGKRALLAYANNLRGFLRASGSVIKVSTIDPYAMHTALAEGLNPIYTEPVDSSGNSQHNPVLQAFLEAVRAQLKTALPAWYVGKTYAQLLSMTDPYFNAAVAQPIDAANAATIEFFNSVVVAENGEAALPLGS